MREVETLNSFNCNFKAKAYRKTNKILLKKAENQSYIEVLLFKEVCLLLDAIKNKSNNDYFRIDYVGEDAICIRRVGYVDSYIEFEEVYLAEIISFLEAINKGWYFL